MEPQNGGLGFQEGPIQTTVKLLRVGEPNLGTYGDFWGTIVPAYNMGYLC